MSSTTLGFSHSSDSESRRSVIWLLDDESVFGELSDVLSRVCSTDLDDFGWVEPDLTLAALKDGSCESFLGC